MFEFKTKKLEESSSNWKPWHKDWDAITSNHSEDDAIKDDGKYRYNRKGFLEDDESSDDSILIVDPGWDDYCLQELKLNRPVPCCSDARRARIVENVMDHLTTTGITTIPGERSIEELEGMSWHLKPPEQTSVRVPSRVAVNERLNRSDYYVKYDAPPDITPIEEIAATGWGDEFSDDEVTPGKVTILEERSDWDNDERSGGKVLVIQERLAQNQQEFLDEYLPQWDEHLAIQKQELESE
ncbi:hypothetical protein Tco_0643309 [Tanacetum coccineum]